MDFKETIIPLLNFKVFNVPVYIIFVIFALLLAVAAILIVGVVALELDPLFGAFELVSSLLVVESVAILAALLHLVVVVVNQRNIF